MELSLAANGMERVLNRVLKGKEVMERDPPTSKPDMLVPGRDYVAADGTVMQEYFDGTDDEEDEPPEQGSAEDILAQRQVPNVTGDGSTFTEADEPEDEEGDLEDFQSVEEGSAEAIVATGGTKAPPRKPTLLQQAEMSAGTAFSRDVLSESEMQAALVDSELTESFCQSQGGSVNSSYVPQRTWRTSAVQ